MLGEGFVILNQMVTEGLPHSLAFNGDLKQDPAFIWGSHHPKGENSMDRGPEVGEVLGTFPAHSPL